MLQSLAELSKTLMKVFITEHNQKFLWSKGSVNLRLYMLCTKISKLVKTLLNVDVRYTAVTKFLFWRLIFISENNSKLFYLVQFSDVVYWDKKWFKKWFKQGNNYASYKTRFYLGSEHVFDFYKDFVRKSFMFLVSTPLAKKRLFINPSSVQLFLYYSKLTQRWGKGVYTLLYYFNLWIWYNLEIRTRNTYLLWLETRLETNFCRRKKRQQLSFFSHRNFPGKFQYNIMSLT